MMPLSNLTCPYTLLSTYGHGQFVPFSIAVLKLLFLLWWAIGAKNLLGMSCPIAERQHVLTLWTISCTLGVCADRASAIDALALHISCQCTMALE